MALKSSIYGHFIIWPSSVTLTFNIPKNVSNGTISPQGEHLCKIILKSMHKCRSYGLDKLNWWPFYYLTFKCDLDLQPTQTNVSNGTTTPQGEQLCQIILKSMRKCRSNGSDISSIYDHFIIWPSSVTFTFNLPKQMFQMALFLLKENTCAKLFWNPCINVEVMAWTSSIDDHFIIWPSSVTLTFNLPKQMFQMALFLLKENTCAKLFWNPCINIEVMAWTSSIYDHFTIWPSSVTLTYNLPKQMFQMALLILKEKNCATLFWNPCINVGVIAQIS